jgi:hypothetical protein
MTLSETLADLPKRCGRRWIGYKSHIDIPVACLLRSASLHDSQAAIPLARIHGAACDQSLRFHGQRLVRPEIHAANPRRGGKAAQEAEARAKRFNDHLAEQRRYNERSTAERVNGSLKDN